VDKKLSMECKDLINKMIVVDRKNRINGEQALQHPWFERCLKRQEGTTDLIDEGVLIRLRQFKGSSTLKKAALNILVKMLNPTEVEDLRQIFQKIDADNSGFIEIVELEKALMNTKH
jgi:calcium-dependent protein kinase